MKNNLNLFRLFILCGVMISCNPSGPVTTKTQDSASTTKTDTSNKAGSTLPYKCPFTIVKFDQNLFRTYYDNSDLYKLRFIPYQVAGNSQVYLYGEALSKNDTTSVIDPPFALPLGTKVQDPRKLTKAVLYDGLMVTKTELDDFMAKINTSFDLDLRPSGCNYEFYLNNNPTGHLLNPSPPGLY